MDQQTQQLVAQVRQWLSQGFGKAFADLDSAELRAQTEPRERPVAGTQQRLKEAQRLSLAGDVKGAWTSLAHAANISLDAAGYPDESEFRGQGKMAARSHACFWRGISCALVGGIESQLMQWDLMACDMWFGQAAWAFFELGEVEWGARAMAEWGEARLAVGDWDMAQMFLRAAGGMYLGLDDMQSSVALLERLAHPGPSRWESAFLLGRSPTEDERLMLVTILGGKNAYALRQAVVNYQPR